MRTPLIYALHSGNLYGTERMALATAAGLDRDFATVVMAPPGPALAEAARLGFATSSFSSAGEFFRLLRPHFAEHRQLAFLATGVLHSFACLSWNAVYRRRVAHLHMVHGGADEKLSYGRKRLLNHLPLRFVAVSGFVRERLLAHRVREQQISVIENFIQPQPLPEHGEFRSPGVRRAVVVSRIDPIKRVDLLLDALDQTPSLGSLHINVLGTGWDLERLRSRAAERHPNVRFLGFQPGPAQEIASADLLIHLCPAEPFGLAILEAMAAGVPALVPNAGGAGALVEDGVSGYRFQANDARNLAEKLRWLTSAPASELNGIVGAGRRLLETRFSPENRIADYRRLLLGALA